MQEPMPTVLVVDDERFFRDAICDALRDAGFACRAVGGTVPALSEASDEVVGVVVLDLRLPEATGLDVLRQLRTQRPSLRVIVVASHTDQEDVLEALRLGASEYLAKPLHDEELVLAVRRAAAAYALETRFAALRLRLHALAARMTTLSARAAAAGVDEREARLFADITAALAEVLGASKTSLMLVDAAGSELRVAAAAGSGVEPRRMDRVAVGSGIAGAVFASGEALAIPDLDADARIASRAPRARYRSRSLAVAPVPGSAGPLGVLCATDREGGTPFGEDDLALMQILARHVSHLLEGPAESADARTRPAPQDGAREPRAELAAAHVSEPAEAAAADADAELARAICDALAVEVEPQRLIEAALRPVARTLSAAPVSLYLIDNASGELRLEGQQDAAGRGDRKSLPRERGLTGLVLQTGRVVATARPQTDPRFDPDVDTPENGVVGPLLCVPLRWRSKVLGVARAFPQGGAPASARTGEVLSAALSAAVRNLLLYRSLLESIEDLAEARREALGPTSP